MAFNPFRQGASARRAYVIRVSGPDRAARRYVVLAAHSGQAMAAVIADLSPCDVAEITDDVLDPTQVARLGLEPDRPHRLA